MEYYYKDNKCPHPMNEDRFKQLRGKNLRGADLKGKDLTYSDLRDADLRKADLRGADLSDSSLSGANLSGADLRGTHGIYLTLIDTDFTGVIVDNDTNLSGTWQTERPPINYPG